MKVIEKIKQFMGVAKSATNSAVNYFTSVHSASQFFGSYNRDIASDKEALIKGYTNPYFFTVINDLAERMVNLPKELYDSEGEISRMPIPLDNLMKKPNDYEGWNEFMYRVFANSLIGDVYVFSATSDYSNRLTDLRGQEIKQTFGNLICPVTYCVTPEYSYDRIISYNVEHRGISYVIPYEKMLHIKVPSLFDTYEYDKGFGAGRASKLIYEASTNQLGTKAGAFGNIGANKLITAKGQNAIMMPKERDAMQTRFDDLVIGRDNVLKSIVASVEMQVLDRGGNIKDYTFPEMNEMDIQSACMMMDVAPQLYGSTKSSTYNNMSEAEKARLIMIVGKASKVYKSLSRFLIEQGNLMIDEDSCIKVDKASIPELNTPNLEYLNFAIQIAGQFNRGELSEQQARAMLSEFDYSDSQMDDLLTKAVSNE